MKIITLDNLSKYTKTILNKIDNIYSTKDNVNTQVVAEVAKIVANAPEDFDTLKEIADYIASDKVNAANINTAISNITAKLSAIVSDTLIEQYNSYSGDNKQTLLDSLSYNFNDIYRQVTTATATANNTLGQITGVKNQINNLQKALEGFTPGVKYTAGNAISLDDNIISYTGIPIYTYKTFKGGEIILNNTNIIPEEEAEQEDLTDEYSTTFIFIDRLNIQYLVKYLSIHNFTFTKINAVDSNDLKDYLKTTDVGDWAKQTTKPLYTAEEVGALPSTTTIPTKTSELENNSNFISAEGFATETDITNLFNELV